MRSCPSEKSKVSIRPKAVGHVLDPPPSCFMLWTSLEIMARTSLLWNFVMISSLHPSHKTHKVLVRVGAVTKFLGWVDSVSSPNLREMCLSLHFRQWWFHAHFVWWLSHSLLPFYVLIILMRKWCGTDLYLFFHDQLTVWRTERLQSKWVTWKSLELNLTCSPILAFRLKMSICF